MKTLPGPEEIPTSGAVSALAFIEAPFLSISAMLAQECFNSLKGPIQMVTPPHTPVPFSPTLEDLYIPSPAAIAAAVKKSMAH